MHRALAVRLPHDLSSIAVGSSQSQVDEEDRAVTCPFRSFRAAIMCRRLEGDGVQQLTESSHLAIKLFTADRGSLGTQFVDHHLAIGPHIHWVDDAA